MLLSCAAPYWTTAVGPRATISRIRVRTKVIDAIQAVPNVSVASAGVLPRVEANSVASIRSMDVLRDVGAKDARRDALAGGFVLHAFEITIKTCFLSVTIVFC